MGQISQLPLSLDLESKAVLRKLVDAHRALAELKGVTGIIRNQNIPINTLSLQEAKESSAIENIITTQDELYKSDALSHQFESHAAKEVYHYVTALRGGYERVKKSALLTNNDILKIQAVIVENSAGFRKLPGTELKNERTGEIVYRPTQEGAQFKALMHNLEQFINDDSLSRLDPLIKMALIHHQFETIHPFYDGNGRTGRIINVLYLVKCSLLDSPILYLSRYINKNRSEYYRLLQVVRDRESGWEEWLLFVLDAVEQTAHQTVQLIQAIKSLMLDHKNRIRDELPRIYSQELLNHLFCHPYTKVDFAANELGIHRNTAKRYLDSLLEIGIFSKHKMGRENFYINIDLFALLQGVD